MQEKKGKLKFLLSTVRSGSTALLHSLSQHPEVETASFLMKNNIFYGKGNDVDYSIYDISICKPHLIYKVTFGFNSYLACTYKPFRNDEDIISTTPVFLFRDPVTNYNSWFKQGWGNIDLFIAAYRHVANLCFYCMDVIGGATCVTYENLAENPESIIRLILRHWSISEIKGISKWHTPFGEGTISFFGDTNDAMKDRFREDINKGIYESAVIGDQQFRFVDAPIIIPENIRCIIDKKLRNIYSSILEKQTYLL